MKISKRVRDEAILICAIAASNPDLGQSFQASFDAMDMNSKESLSVACLAWFNVGALCPIDRVVWAAEAEALLQTGWSP